LLALPVIPSEGKARRGIYRIEKKPKDTMSEIDKSGVWPDEDDLIYVSDETYKGVYRALDHMEKAREELRKAAEAEKPKIKNDKK
jgi:hypothetical protein